MSSKKDDDETVSELVQVILVEDDLSDEKEMQRLKTILRIAKDLGIELQQPFFQELITSGHRDEVVEYLVGGLGYQLPDSFLKMLKTKLETSTRVAKMLQVS